MRQVNAPTLPDGYRFKVRQDSDGDVVISLQKETWLGAWKTLGVAWFRPASCLVKGQQVELTERYMRRLALENALEVESMDETESVLGIYPPRKIIGEVDG